MYYIKQLVLFIIILINYSYFSQCNVIITASNNPVICGSNVNQYATAYSGSPVMSNNFDLGNAGAGWNVTTAADFTNPCGPGTGSTYLWMGISPQHQGLYPQLTSI